MSVIFKKENLKTIILTIVYLLSGILFCSMQVKMFNFVESVLCFVLIAGGVVCISVYALMSSEDKNFKLFVYGIIAVSFGFLMLVLSKFFGIFLAIMVGYNGVVLIVQALKDRKKNDKSWISYFVVGVIVTALSIVVLILSSGNVVKKILSIFFGTILLFEAVFNIVELVMMAVLEKKKSKTIETNKDEKIIVPDEDVKVSENDKG